ncbi:MAG: xylulokinase [Armatimonadetes bacterium]|nr:xylulokinase [Armatimonadota bacterium]NIM23597.1 xylulokinase [Armatimonadota bacterium]NIM67463.1 xylulokinase [Armatimonadota bacterium]NIM75960.1 xylulokinase [Armatimonadota bacterium]NIN05649.1 xylulokinase [Armatimonadota bacterium]
MNYLMGLDVGTTGTKVLITDVEGNIIASVVEEYPLHTPKPGWAEQDPADWWKATVQGIRRAIAEAKINPADIKGLGLSGQMHGSVFLDSSWQVVRPAILWCDQRTAEQCRWITERVGEKVVVEETLNPVLTGFTAPKIAWLQQKEPENWKKTKKVLLPKDYIRFLLTGEFATEVSDASGMSLLNVPKRKWSAPMLAGLDLTEDMLAKVYESWEPSAKINKEAAEATGLKEGTPVVGGGGDQAAGAVGNGIVEPGVLSVSTGTSGVIFAYMDKPAVDPQLRTHTFCHAVPDKWHVMGVMLSAGGSLRWYRDAFAGEEKAAATKRGVDPYEIITEECEKVPVGSEGLVFLPYLTGERTPYPDPHARGAFVGLHLRHTKPHIARAVMEGVSYGLRDSLEILRAMEVPISQVRASGGGARSALWRQIQADVFGCELVTINVDEGPAFGVALLAGVGAGIYSSVPEACKATIRVVSSTSPNAKNAETYAALYEVYRSLYPALKPGFEKLAGMA